MSAQDWFERGVKLGKEGKSPEAIDAYNQAIEMNPRFAEAFCNRGLEQGKLDRHREALESFKKAREINPKYANAWHNEGIAYYNLHQYGEAIEPYRRAGDLCYELGEDYRKADQYKEAAEAYHGAGEAYRGAGDAYRKLDRRKEADEAYHRAAEAYHKAGDNYDKVGEHDKAADAYHRAGDAYSALSQHKEAAQAWNSQGVMLAKSRRHDEAFWPFRKAIEAFRKKRWEVQKIEPKDSVQLANAWRSEGFALWRLGWYEEALEALRAARREKESADNWCKEGLALAGLGRHDKDYKEALEAFDKAIDTNDQLAEAWFGKGFALGRLGRYKEALEALGKAKELGLKDERLYGAWGEILLDMGYVEGAAKRIMQALDRDPDDAWVLIVDGRIKLDRKEYAAAVCSFEKAIWSDLGNPLPLLWYAYAEYLRVEFTFKPESRRYREGLTSIISELKRAPALCKPERELEPKAYVLYFLGCLYFKNKDNYAATESLEECVKLESNIRGAAYALLNDIWNYKIRPPWWRWWLFSPSNRWWKRISFAGLLGSTIGLFGLHPFIPVWFPCIEVNWTFYGGFILLLVALLALPSLERIKVMDIEVELRSPPRIESVLSPPPI